MGGGDDADDVTTELLEPAGRTADAASAMMDAVAKASADEAEGPAAVALPAAALSAAVAAATAAGTVGDSEEPDAGPLSQPLVSPPLKQKGYNGPQSDLMLMKQAGYLYLYGLHEPFPLQAHIPASHV